MIARTALGRLRLRPWPRLGLRLPLRPTPADLSGVFWFGAAAVYVTVLALCMTLVSYDVWGALVLGPVLAGVALPWLRRSVARDDPTMVSLVTAAFVVKMLGSVVRYLVTFGIYDEAADALSYHEAGGRIASGFWAGQGGLALEQETPNLVGTPFIRVVTGVLYAITGPTLLGGFLVFGLLSFVGLYLFYRALRIAFPAADHRRYALFLFFLPTLLYWPSSIGKEAWMIFALGLATYGVALVLEHQLGGYVCACLGLLGTAMVRPHVTALALVALTCAYILRRRSWRASRLGPVGKVAGILLLLVAGAAVLGRVAQFFELDEMDSSSVESVLQYTEGQSTQGGSEFQAVRPQSITGFPLALVSVLFRPYPWEADNPQMQVAALEGVVLLAAFASSWRRLARVPATMRHVPYLAYCVAFVVMFVVAFSSIGNFGIMTRQRAQLFPFVLVLLTLPLPTRGHPTDLDERAPTGLRR